MRGSGDHPLSEPEIEALVRAIVARPNVCGYNAFHTSGGVLLRPSSTQPDAALPPRDVWTWKQLGEIGTALTGYPVHSVYEDFTWDKAVTMSGAADDWAYEHLGVYSWTTEFWDVVRAATGTPASTDSWELGPTDEQALAVLRWADEHAPGHFVDWYPFEHPQLGPVELGGWPYLGIWTNPPADLLRAEVAAHAEFAVARRWRRRAWRSATSRPSTSAAARGGSRSASPTAGGCRPTCRPGRPRSDLVRPIVAEAPARA